MKARAGVACGGGGEGARIRGNSCVRYGEVGPLGTAGLRAPSRTMAGARAAGDGTPGQCRPPPRLPASTPLQRAAHPRHGTGNGVELAGRPGVGHPAHAGRLSAPGRYVPGPLGTAGVRASPRAMRAGPPHRGKRGGLLRLGAEEPRVRPGADETPVSLRQPRERVLDQHPSSQFDKPSSGTFSTA